MAVTNTLPGSKAPSFNLPNHKGEMVSLNALLKNGPVMIVFYPGDFTMVCTKQLCNYQSSLPEFKNYGIQVVGISNNNSDSHEKFAAEYGFEFSLLADPAKLAIKAYGVTSFFTFGGTSRAVFIVSQQGTILYRHVEPTSLLYRRTDELLKVIKELKDKQKL